jgi:hypothetical protein
MNEISIWQYRREKESEANVSGTTQESRPAPPRLLGKWTEKYSAKCGGTQLVSTVQRPYDCVSVVVGLDGAGESRRRRTSRRGGRRGPALAHTPT